MVNFIRAQSRAVGRWPPDLSSGNAFQSEDWLLPQLEDDALLYNLQDVMGEDLEDEMGGVTFGVGQIEVDHLPQRDYILSRDPGPENPIYQIAEMEERVKSAQRDLEKCKKLLASDVQLHDRLGNGPSQEETFLEAPNSPSEVNASGTESEPNGNTSKTNRDTDSSYFASYSGHGKCFFDLARLSNAEVDRHSRNYVERHNTNRCIQRLHI